MESVFKLITPRLELTEKKAPPCCCVRWLCLLSYYLTVQSSWWRSD